MKRIIAVLLFVFLAGSTSVFADSIETIDKDELKGMLDSQDLVVLDVRTGRDWSSSEFKIKGAVRLEKGDIEAAMDTYSKDQTIVLYCA